MSECAGARKNGALARKVEPCAFLDAEPLSAWAGSRAKRGFDIALVLAALPIVVPVCLLIAIAIRVTSRGPILFRQIRVGRHEDRFSIIKFRSMYHGTKRGTITTINDRQITPVGRYLRRWKLDELPQLINVLAGEMSLVGPRPRVPEQPVGRIDCLPGITGAATLAFAREEILLAGVPRRELATYYARRVIPVKQELDDAYMARATFFSDMKLIFRSVFRVLRADGAPPASGPVRDWRGNISVVVPEESRD